MTRLLSPFLSAVQPPPGQSCLASRFSSSQAAASDRPGHCLYGMLRPTRSLRVLLPLCGRANYRRGSGPSGLGGPFFAFQSCGPP